MLAEVVAVREGRPNIRGWQLDKMTEVVSKGTVKLKILPGLGNCKSVDNTG